MPGWTLSLSKLLVNARLQRLLIPNLPSDLESASFALSEAYNIQNHILTDPSTPFGKLIGWKCGATNNAAQASLGLQNAFYGPLFEKNLLPTDCQVSLSSLGAFRASEAEFAFYMSEDLIAKPDNTPYTNEEVWSRISFACPVIELAATRFEVPLTPALIISDFALNGCVVLGEKFDPSMVSGGASALAQASAILEINGAQVAANTGSNVLGSPLNSLTWLANELIAAGHCLRAGELVITGAAAAHGPLKAGDALTARFNGFHKDKELIVTLNTIP